jgi:sterol desaturase/sphingolipid hydroxylase (fatty acid hydroxylase superfamily)
MTRFIVAAFFVLHGLVHLLYVGQSQRFFELQPGMTWPDGSWIFSKVLRDRAVRGLASALLVLVALVFVIAGVGLLARQPWWRPVGVAAAGLSSLIFVLFWDGRPRNLDDQGAIALLLNAAILLALLVVRWPRLIF